MTRNALRDRQIRRLDQAAKQRRFTRELERINREWQAIHDSWGDQLAEWKIEIGPDPTRKPWWRFW